MTLCAARLQPSRSRSPQPGDKLPVHRAFGEGPLSTDCVEEVGIKEAGRLIKDEITAVSTHLDIARSNLRAAIGAVVAANPAIGALIAEYDELRSRLPAHRRRPLRLAGPSAAAGSRPAHSMAGGT